MVYRLGLFGLLSCCAAEATESSPWYAHATNLSDASTDELNSLVFETDMSTLVLYTAPVCTHCRAVETDYGKLAAEYVSSTKVLFAYYNCSTKWRKSSAGAMHLSKHNVTKFPSLRYFNPPMERTRYENGTVLKGGPVLSSYTGSRKPKAMRDFAATLGPLCLPTTWDKYCSDEQKASLLEPYMTDSPTNLMNRLAAVQKDVAAKQAEIPMIEAERMKSFGKTDGEHPREIMGRKVAAEDEALRLVDEMSLLERALSKSFGSKPKDEF